MTNFDTRSDAITSKAAFTASSIGPDAVAGRVLELVGQYSNKMSVTNDFKVAPGLHA